MITVVEIWHVFIPTHTQNPLMPLYNDLLNTHQGKHCPIFSSYSFAFSRGSYKYNRQCAVFWMWLHSFSIMQLQFICIDVLSSPYFVKYMEMVFVSKSEIMLYLEFSYLFCLFTFNKPTSVSFITSRSNSFFWIAAQYSLQSVFNCSSCTTHSGHVQIFTILANDKVWTNKTHTCSKFHVHV